jgi:predicted dehydrogenase (TIGR03970 family)
MAAHGYDLIIVGAGSAGCVLAARLSENPARRVLLLEAGPDHATIDDFPAGIALGTSVPAWVPGHPASWQLTARLSDAQPDYPLMRGRIAGGSSAINGTIFLRGRPADFDAWAAQGCDLWSYEQVLPFFRRSERDYDFTGAEFHGQDGPMPVTRPLDEPVRPIAEAFQEACLAAGFPDEPDKNVPGAEGVGPIPRNLRYGVRMNTAMAYLSPEVRARPNLTVIGDTLVRRVLFDGTRATGVEAERDGAPATFGADQVILSAGGIKSPQLLLLSGVGPAADLRAHGIPVIHDNPGVGHNVADHPTIFPVVGLGALEPLPEGVMMTHTGLHHTAPGSSDTSDLEITWGRFQGVVSFNLPLNVAKSRGTITLGSADPAAAPVIDLNYLSHPDDLPRLVANLRIALELLESGPFRPLQLSIYDGLSTAMPDDELARWIRANLQSCMHTHNSTAMGPASDPAAVVDQRCRVHGVEGLRVADVGIVPFVRTGPAATAVMIGERVAALVEEDATALASGAVAEA